MVVFIGFDDTLVAVVIVGDGGIHGGEIESGLGFCCVEIVAVWPSLDVAVPLSAADGDRERQRAAFDLGCRT